MGGLSLVRHKLAKTRETETTRLRDLRLSSVLAHSYDLERPTNAIHVGSVVEWLISTPLTAESASTLINTIFREFNGANDLYDHSRATTASESDPL